ncbi:ABC transporter permease [Pimelobacter simplex]|uniref:ABC transporter permease n=1 Tax=Nocardioides simplex TaxID=2045 RepID=UPI003AADD916
MTTLSLSLPRTLRLARWNAVLLTRNRLALTYGTVLPLLPLALLLGGDRGDEALGAATIATVLTMAFVFPVFYNVLSQFVTRRDELVLKRLRTGEARDAELLTALVLPGAVIALAVALLAVPVAAAFGQDLPRNPLLYVVGALACVALYAAFAFWTAAWTRNAEAAQLTSLPVILLAIGGQISLALPDAAQRWAELTPGAALTGLVRVTWFGMADGRTTSTLDLAATWGAAAPHLAVLVAWTAVACWLAARSLHWEPRV